jgi:hypothetical protein
VVEHLPGKPEALFQSLVPQRETDRQTETRRGGEEEEEEEEKKSSSAHFQGRGTEIKHAHKYVKQLYIVRQPVKEVHKVL